MEILPEVTITHEDFTFLTGVVQEAIAEGRYTAASRLGDELRLARVVLVSQASDNCLLLNLVGRYLEERSGAVSDVVLVAGQGSSSFGMVSVLSQVSTALLALSEGQRMGWFDPRGKPRVVRLLKVCGPAA